MDIKNYERKIVTSCKENRHSASEEGAGRLATEDLPNRAWRVNTLYLPGTRDYDQKL